jgi:hypothetical protein
MKKSIRITTKNVGKKKFDIFLNCNYCGKPITETSEHFGMDCEDHCAEKKFNELFKQKK